MSPHNFLKNILFPYQGSTLLWNDKAPSYALKEILDWNFKIRYFIDTDEFLTVDHEAGKIAMLKTFIEKVK